MTGESLPLAGCLVVTLEQAVAAPMATRHLADLGARVIKLERPDGGDFARGYNFAVQGLASHFVWLNRGKESVCVDLKSERDRAIALAVLGAADVFVQNCAPGVVERLGLDADDTARDLARLDCREHLRLRHSRAEERPQGLRHARTS